MLYSKEPAAHEASARRAEVDGTRPGPTQFVLPLLSSAEEMSPAGLGHEHPPVLPGEAERPSPGASCSRTTVVSRQNTQATDPVGEEGHRGSGNEGSRKENAVRRQRIKSPISVVAIKRVLAAVGKAGMSAISLEVRPDGAIVVGTAAANDDQVDVFAQWADRL